MTNLPKRHRFGFEPVPDQPTARNVQSALAFLEAHRRLCVPAPESVCQWCRQRWPCPTAQWAQRVLKRSATNIPAHDTTEHDSPAQPP